MTHDLVAALRPLLTAEASAEAYAAGASPATWSRPSGSGCWSDWRPTGRRWTRRAGCAGAVRAEARRSRRTTRLERPYEGEPADDLRPGPEQHVLTAARYRALRDAVRRLPGRCPRLIEALLSPQDPTYREIAGELGISQGSSRPGTLQMSGMSAPIAPRRRLRRAKHGDREWGTTGDQVSGRHAHMGMSVTISVATEQDAEQIFRLQYLCFQSEAALYGNYRIDPLVQTLDSVRQEVASTASCRPARRRGGRLGARQGHRGRRRGYRQALRPPPASRDTASARACCARRRRPWSRSAAPRRSASLTGHRSEGNLRLYRRVGYQTVGRAKGDDGVELIVLEKQAGQYAQTA